MTNYGEGYMTEPTNDFLDENARLLAAKDERLVRQQQQIDRILTATEGDQQVIADLKNEVERLKRGRSADTPSQLFSIIREAVDVDGVDVTCDAVEDESFTIKVHNATIRDSEIVAPTRRFLVEGTITAPVSFVVEAVDEEEADRIADDVLSDVAMNVESDLDMARPDDCTDFGAGLVDRETDQITED